MNLKKYIADFTVTFSITLIVSVIVTFLYSLFVYNSGIIDWETSFRFAIIFGIVFPWINQRNNKQRTK